MIPSLKLFSVAIALVTVVNYILVCDANIHDKVSYHELITASKATVKTRVRRSVVHNAHLETQEKEFHFQAYNMTFNCHLKPRTDFFAPKFKLKVYKADGIPKEFGFRHDQIFIGSCDGDSQSEIRGTFKGDVFSGSLFYKGQMYGIEDAERHIPSVPVNEHMIIYRASDMKWNKESQSGKGGHFCGNTDSFSADPAVDTDKITVDKVVNDQHRRRKRATEPAWNTCRILVVADYKFFRAIGRSDIYDTALHLSGVMDRVDTIFRRTEFNLNGVPYSGMGFEIAEMRILETPTAGFNKDTGSWDAQTLLQTFSTDLSFKTFCLAHLFTHQSFQGNTLGMAYIASDQSEDIGGICSPESYIRALEARASENTGFSSSRNGYGETVLLQQSDLVTAHELGHNWGSNHDPSSGSCAPSDIFGDGKYIMYAISVSGYDSNNYVFSTCSRNAIGRVLYTKRGGCFSAKTVYESQICGNGRLDPGEECDDGLLGRLNLKDACCNSDCTFKSGSTCSPVNHECCVNCQAAGTDFLCRSDTGIGCQKSAFCDGTSLACPASENKENGSPCLDEGECKNGECESFCQAKNQTPCACSTLADSCQRCCRAGEGAECVPYDNNHPLPDGRPCVAGYCEAAVCISSSESTIQRLFSILDDLTVDTVVKFFRDNLVGCVIVFSLLLWIPASIAVTCMDRRKRKQLNRSEEIEIRRDRELMFDEDGRKVGIPRSPAPQNGTTSPRYRTLNFTDLGGFGSDA